MGGDYGVVYPLWSHSDEPGGLWERLLGEVGVNHLTVPVISGPVASFRPNPPPGGPHLFAAEGGWHYPPAPGGYPATAVRARSAGWFGKRNLLKAVCESAAARAVRIDAEIDLRGVSGLYEHEPHLRMRNAWGDELPGTLCVCNPDLRALCEEVVGELAGYGVGGVQLTDALVMPTRLPGDFAPAWERDLDLLTLCFCPSCRAIASRAELDVEVATRLTRTLLLEPPGEVEEPGPCPRPPLVGRVQAACRQDHAAWLARLAVRFPDLQWSLRVIPPPARAGESAAELEAETRAADDEERVPQESLGEPEGLWPDDFRLLVSVAQPQAAAADASARRHGRGGGIRVPVWRPAFEHHDELVRFTHGARLAGVEYFDFAGVDSAPPYVLTWLHQALRFSRREDSAG